MLSQVALLITLFFISAASGLAQDSNCTGVKIGDLPDVSNNVSGEFFIEDEYSFCIRNFFYDGGGPDTFLYFYYPGADFDGTGGGVFINITTTQGSELLKFEPGRAYNGETFRIALAKKRFRTCDFGVFTMWCRYVNFLFTNISWTMNDQLLCTRSPGRGYVGDLTAEKIGGGDLYIVDNKTFAIRNFIYNGSAPDLFVYWYPPGAIADPKGNGNIIPLTKNNGPEGNFDATNYTGLPMEDFEITIPDNMDVFTCDVGIFTIWCRKFQIIFTQLPINLQLFTNNPSVSAYEPNRILCNRPTTRPGVLVGEFPTDDPKAISGTVYVRDQWILELQLFSFDAKKDAFFYYYRVGEEIDNSGGGEIIKSIARRDSMAARIASYSYNQDVTVDLREAMGGKVKICEIGYFTVYVPDEKMHLTQIKIPQDIFSSDGSDGKILCGGAHRLAMTYLLTTLCSLLAYALLY